MMGDAIKHCAANLMNFDGRDARSTFWWWILVVVVVTFLISLIAGIVFAASAMSGVLQSAASGVDQSQVEIEMMQSMASGMETQFFLGAAVSVLGLALIIATFVRRLRDAGLPVLIAIIPVVTTIWGLYAGYSQLGGIADLMAAGGIAGIEEHAASAAGSSLISYVGYLVVIVVGVIPTKAS